MEVIVVKAVVETHAAMEAHAAMETTHTAVETSHTAVEASHTAVEASHTATPLSVRCGRKYRRGSGCGQDTAGSEKPSYPTHIGPPICPRFGSPQAVIRRGGRGEYK
jgi:hypothetical protein